MKNKIDAETKWFMQFISFLGMVAALRLITWGLYTTVAWAGFAINLYSLITWCCVEEVEDDELPKE